MSNTISNLLLASTLTLVWCGNSSEPQGAAEYIKNPSGSHALIVTLQGKVACIHDLESLKEYQTNKIDNWEKSSSQILKQVLNIKIGDSVSNGVSNDGRYSRLRDKQEVDIARFINSNETGNKVKLLYTKNEANKVCENR